ncbi:MAG: polyprenyl synthetase family protein [Deltaproteobacteria bacterium]|nr:polyprenyl synthetase family protein [Deltaproteobacteria bacterium]
MLSSAVKSVGSSELLSRLGEMCVRRGLHSLADRLLGLTDFIERDLETVEGALEGVSPPDALVGRAAGHLLAGGGKRLRPLCVALASRTGSGFNPAALHVAVAVELVHNATLLHDDVVDLATTRRGARTAAAEFGNAASIFGGDWLLIEALRRVRHTEMPDLLGSLLETIEEMILAESVQLDNRGKLDATAQSYFRVAEGKTAALFRWAMMAGGRTGGLAPEDCASLSRYGLHLGVAFQLIDDVLDFTGDSRQTGKALLTDLREGMMTYPLILTLERQPELRPVLQEILEVESGEPPPPILCERVSSAVRHTGAATDSRRLARQRSLQATDSLKDLPDGPARRTLIAVAEAIVNRSH